MEITTLLSLLGSGCCCVSVFLIAIVGLSLAFRPRRPKADDIAGIASAPARGFQTRASLTRMDEEEPTRRDDRNGRKPG